MSWVRPKAHKVRADDPFQFLNVTSPQNLVANAALNEMRRSKRQLIFIGSVVTLAMATIAVLFTTQLNLYFDNTSNSYAYFQIKTIDANGRPVAGAQVYRNNESVGVTDSFGEWRRYIEVELGQTMELRFTKSRLNTVSQAIKKILIPESKPSKGDIEIFSSVQLISKRNDPITTAKIKEPSQNPPQTNDIKSVVDSKLLVEFIPLHDENSSSRNYIAAKNQVLSYVNKFIKSDTSHFQHDCEKLNMFYIPFESSRGFVEVTCEGPSPWSILRNLETSKKATATKIYHAMHRTAKMIRSGQPPVSGWQKLSLVITGSLAESTGIYVSGYPALPDKEGYWRYWGQKNGQANSTIIRDKTVEFRQRISNNPYGARYINLPHKSVAKRN